jgi:hypothetical protein
MKKSIINKHINNIPSSQEERRKYFLDDNRKGKGELLIVNNPSEPTIYILDDNDDIVQIQAEIKNNSITEDKINNAIIDKINESRHKSNLADTLRINDGIVWFYGSFTENYEIDEFNFNTTSSLYSNKLMNTGEKIVVNDGYIIHQVRLYNEENACINQIDINSNIFDGFEPDKTQKFIITIKKENNISFEQNEFSYIVKTYIHDTVIWGENSDINLFTSQGDYKITGERVENAQDNLPTLNYGDIEGKLTVFTSTNSVTQILTIVNDNKRDGNVYIRTKKNDEWGIWSKLQTQTEIGHIGLGSDKTFDNYTESGLYSGVNVFMNNNIPDAEAFILITLNAEAISGTVSQLKYSLFLDGTNSVSIRSKNEDDTWGEWNDFEKDKYILPVATDNELGGIKIGFTNTGKQYAVLLNNDKKAYVQVPWISDEATVKTPGLMSSNDKTKLDSIETGANKYVLPKASNNELGGMKIGEGLTIDTGGTVSVVFKEYTLPAATNEKLGGVIVGKGLSVDSGGTISVTDIDDLLNLTTNDIKINKDYNTDEETEEDKEDIKAEDILTSVIRKFDIALANTTLALSASLNDIMIRIEALTERIATLEKKVFGVNENEVEETE